MQNFGNGLMSDTNVSQERERIIMKLKKKIILLIIILIRP